MVGQKRLAQALSSILAELNPTLVSPQSLPCRALVVAGYDDSTTAAAPVRDTPLDLVEGWGVDLLEGAFNIYRNMREIPGTGMLPLYIHGFVSTRGPEMREQDSDRAQHAVSGHRFEELCNCKSAFGDAWHSVDSGGGWIHFRKFAEKALPIIGAGTRIE